MTNQYDFDITIGRLDRVISELMIFSKEPLDTANFQTLKHHAEDMEAAAKVILGRIGKAVEGTPQPEYITTGNKVDKF